MNKTIKNICALLLAGVSVIFAFESYFSRPVDYDRDDVNLSKLTGNPACEILDENREIISIFTRFSDMGYKRTYDPASTQLYLVDYSTSRRINEKSFFSAHISYDEYRQQDLFSSMEKDFYDDYFSMIDSTMGNAKYYGPKLGVLYNVQLAENLYFGIEGNYGIERSLKDTFPKTISIMRNSEYNLGLDYRKELFNIGIHGRYYDDQTYYEAVKSYSDVQTKTYIGYNVYFNESSGSKIEKKRARNGLEYGGHFRLGNSQKISFSSSVSGLSRVSRADLIRSSKTKERGLWQRQGINVLFDLAVRPLKALDAHLYGDYLHFVDWGESRISNTLVLENEESYAHLGGLITYRPTMLQKVYLGGEIGKVTYDYKEYVFPFEEFKEGNEWKLYVGGNLYLTSKTKVKFNLDYEKEIPKFYWDTQSFQNSSIAISLEQLFSFGYIEMQFENISKKPSNDNESISIMQFGLSYRRK